MGFITTNNQSNSSSSSTSNQLRTLNDCFITSPVDNQQLVYDGNINRWTNKSVTHILNVTTVQTIAQRNSLTGMNTGDVCIVVNDSTSTNNGSYIYNGSSWSTLSLYVYDHTILLNIGTNSHAQIDTFISSKGQNLGLASLLAQVTRSMLGAPAPAPVRSGGGQVVCCPANRVKFQAKSPIATPTTDAARKFGAAAEAQPAGYVGQPEAPP